MVSLNDCRFSVYVVPEFGASKHNREQLLFDLSAWCCGSQHHAVSLCVSCLRGAASSLSFGIYIPR